MKMLALDPGSHFCGLAFFENKKLYGTETITTTETDPIKRRHSILATLSLFLRDFDVIVAEAPVLLGANNNGMQRFLGVVEFLTRGKVNFFHPMTIKKAMGSGLLNKPDMAKAAMSLLKTKEERDILENAVSRRAFDETDAVCAGLCYFSKAKEEKEDA